MYMRHCCLRVPNSSRFHSTTSYFRIPGQFYTHVSNDPQMILPTLILIVQRLLTATIEQARTLVQVKGTFVCNVSNYHDTCICRQADDQDTLVPYFHFHFDHNVRVQSFLKL